MGTPRLFTVVPNPVTVGTAITVGGAADVLLAGASNCSAVGLGNLSGPILLDGSSACIAVGSSSDLLSQFKTNVPVLIELSPNPVTVGTSLTVTGDSAALLAGTSDLVLGSSADLGGTYVPLAGVSAPEAAGVSSLIVVLDQTAPPILETLVSSPVTVGQTFTANGYVPGVLGVAGVGSCVGSSTASLVVTASAILLPAALQPSDVSDSAGTVQVSNGLQINGGGWIEFRVDGGPSGGIFNLNGLLQSLSGSRYRIEVDSEQQGSDRFVSSQEEEKDIMPASSTVEATISVSGVGNGTGVRLDPTPSANRYMVKVINPHPSSRLAIQRVSPASGGAPTITVADVQQIEPDFGESDFFVGPDVALYARAVSAGPISVRVIQHVP